MFKAVSTLACATLLLCQLTAIHARQPYHATVSVGLASGTVSAPNLVDLTNDLKTANIDAFIPFYTPVTPVGININLRGIDLLTSFAANSNTLVVSIPQAGITQTFTGATRDESLRLLREFIRNGGNDQNGKGSGRGHGRLLKAYAKFSPIDPIAGNPNSLMALMAQSDYLLGHLSPLSGCDCCWNAQPIVHQFQLGSFAGRAFSRGFDTTSATFPLRYSYSPDLNWALILDAPLTYNRNGGASSIVGSVGMGLRIPVTHDWSLTPIVRGGAGGSLDLCTSGSFISAGLTSVYNYKFCEYVLSMTNYAGYISSTNLWLSGINFNYHLHNYIFKNGLSLTSCQGFTLCNRPVNFSISFEDSCFTREHLFIKHYDEVGISMITNYINPCIDYDCLSLGFFYQFGQKNYKGYFLNLAYQF